MRSIKIKNLVLASVFTALICVLSVISVPIGSVPISLGVLAIFLTGALLQPKYAFLSTIIYLLIGSVGLPVFAGFNSGIGTFGSFTGGYLLSYPLMALIISLFVHKIKINKLLALTLGMVTAIIVCYCFGSLWVTLVVAPEWTFAKAMKVCIIPFIPYDLLKMLVVLVSYPLLNKALTTSKIIT